jgi:hypothetical protein
MVLVNKMFYLRQSSMLTISHACIYLRLKLFLDIASIIEVRFHKCRTALENGYVKFIKLASAENFADILTKPLTGEQFHYLRQQLTNFIF